MFMLLIFFFFFLLPFLLISVILGLHGYGKKGEGRGEGGPRTHPVIGCLLSFNKNKRRLLDWYTALLADSPTQTIIISRLGARRTVVTANPDNVEHMLRTNFANYPKGQPFTDILGDLLGSGIFNADGELWHSQRKLASHGFTARSLRDFVDMVLESEVNERLVPVLESACRDGRVVDMQDLLKRFAFDTICRVSLGVDPGCLDPSLLESKLAKAFEVAAEISARRGAAVLPIVWKAKRALGIGSERVLRENVKIIHDCIMDLIQRKISEQEEGKGNDGGFDFLSRLISAGHGMEVVRDMVISFIMAGRDTTSAALTWLLWLLSQHPTTQQEVVQEVVQLQLQQKGNTTTTTDTNVLSDYHALREMKLLEACLHETMRLYPPVAWDSKHAARRDTLPDGTVVEKGDRVTYFPYGMGRMETLWGKTSSEFDPRRWFAQGESKEILKVSAYKFPVFQAGPRVCLGKEMAFIQMKYVAAAVLRRFELVPISNEKPVFVPLLTAHMAGGLRVVVRERDVERSQLQG